MTINKRVSPKKPLFAEVHNVPDDYRFTTEELDRIISGDMFTPRQDAIMARELQQYRAAAEPVAYDQAQRDHMKDILIHKLSSNLTSAAPLVMADIHACTMALMQAGFRAAPQVTSVQEEYAIKASGISDVLKDAADYAPLTAGQWHTLVKNWHQTFCGLAEGVAAPAVPAEPDYRDIVERVAVVLHGSVTDLALLPVTAQSVMNKLAAPAVQADQQEPVSHPYTLPDDKQRLDWLDAQNKRLNEYYGTAYGWKFDANFQRNAMMLNDSNYPVMNVRQAIDEAMRTATRLQESQEVKK